MKRYTFLLLAFFLSLPSYAFDVMAVSAAPNTGSSSMSSRGGESDVVVIKQSSARNAREVANAKESKISLKDISCKTYEGKVFDKGEAGYNDCIRTIKADRLNQKSVP